MGRLNTDADAAFGLLRESSQSRNVKLRDIAHELLLSLPTAGGDPPQQAPFHRRGEPPAANA